MQKYGDIAIEAAMSMGKISTLFDEMYDGGEFCKGLLFAKEASYIVFKIGTQVMNKGNVDKPIEKQEKQALEHKFLQWEVLDIRPMMTYKYRWDLSFSIQILLDIPNLFPINVYLLPNNYLTLYIFPNQNLFLN